MSGSHTEEEHSKGGGRFSESDLRWLEQIVRHLGPPLESVFLMRNLRARTMEAERSRISRDLHDGILQTLLSLIIQLDVLRHTVAAESSKGEPPRSPTSRKSSSRRARSCAGW